ncbi:glycoside hydrolase family 92 protein [Novosphingobium profundi]|uniref:GH92 family glycosyl hydrolase n=1 Tax=Novosphingobium profundi TaxID=1774954 RepID=UPI001BD9F8DD|nr:GH92 family glycosyl hydrolase [Novosphingobium profundi]MBT0667946.1 glycoside hydrolase family 92 protein [Novosphingobium profundi]
MTQLARRALLTGTCRMALFAAPLLAAAPSRGWARSTPAAKTQGKADLFIGTGGDGHTFPGASMPFGMVQLSPDTDVARWDTCSGYHHGDASIMGFSHTHLSGTGIGDMLDVLVQPCRGSLRLVPGGLDSPEEGYRLRYTDEVAEPGYYAVALENGVRSELTVTRRTGLQRHTFPKGAGHFVIDLSHLVKDSSDHAPLIDDAELTLADDGTLTGTRRVFRWAKGRRIYFAMQFSRQPDRIDFFGDDDAPAAPGTRAILGKRLKAVAWFDDAGAEPITLRTAVSGVDVAGARANLAAEAPDFAFERVRAEAAKVWAAELGRVTVTGGTAAQRTIFNSAQYHAAMGPTLFSDVDGRYVGLDHEVHRLPAGENAYSAYSLWDTYRAFHPLQTLLRPALAREMVSDLIRQTQQSRYGPPVWPLQGVETGCMIGWHAVPVLAEALAKGIEADYAAAWPDIKRRALDLTTPTMDNSLGIPQYDKQGYVPADEVFESVSRTLEYSYDDYAGAQIARAAGDEAGAARLLERSGNWKNVFDTRRGFAVPRFADGSFWADYDPIQLGHAPKQWRDYTESNGWQATFLNQHDVPGLVAAMGGDTAFEAKLDALFNAPSTLPDNAPPDISGLVGQYAHGNEPSHHVAYLYAWSGAHWKTQGMVRRLLTEMYAAKPDGVIGNDDCGQMSAWFILSAMGFYPVDPVSAVYVLGSPLFDTATVRLENGRTLTIRALNNGPDKPYYGRVEWNGTPLERCWIRHSELAEGGELTFHMQARPDTAFGRAPSARPDAART